MPADENVREVGSAHRLITPLRWPLGTAPPTFSDSPFIKLDFQKFFFSTTQEFNGNISSHPLLVGQVNPKHGQWLQ